MLNLRLWANRAFSTALSVSFLGGALFGGLVLVPLYFEIQLGQSTVYTGLLLIGQGAGAALTMPLSGRLTDRLGGGVVSVAGLLVTLAATLPLVALGAHPSFLLVETIFTMRGLGVLGAFRDHRAGPRAVCPALRRPTPQTGRRRGDPGCARPRAMRFVRRYRAACLRAPHSRSGPRRRLSGPNVRETSRYCGAPAWSDGPRRGPARPPEPPPREAAEEGCCRYNTQRLPTR